MKDRPDQRREGETGAPVAGRGAPLLSVLMVTYGGDAPDDLEAALASLADQTRPADEVVLVRNGPLSAAQEAAIARWAGPLRLAGPVLSERVSFPRALNAGLALCRGRFVARMDSDDICRPERFAMQLDCFATNPELDVLGSSVEEFDRDHDRPHRTKEVPLHHDAILRMARWRNPMNHMSVMFRRDVVLEAGGYGDLPGFEDYELWVRLLARGRRFANLPKRLVAARIGNGFLNRRRGLSYARAEWRAMARIAAHGLHNPARVRLSMPLRFVVRCLPRALMGLAYRPLRRAP